MKKIMPYNFDELLECNDILAELKSRSEQSSICASLSDLLFLVRCVSIRKYTVF